MYGLAKFLWHVMITFRDLWNVDRNPLCDQYMLTDVCDYYQQKEQV